MGSDPTPRRLGALRSAVLAGAARWWRDLPWRHTRDPWRVLVSEVMLQQTQAPRVVEPYLAYVARFPTPTACARAGQAASVRAWSGLGYNRRAVALHRAATVIDERHGGRVPDDLDALLALPGVGEYTARAVLAFAFERHVGVVDTNVARLLARAVAGRSLRATEAQQLADRLVPAAESWRFNQALFDLGAQVCTSQRPSCPDCPLRQRCRWALGGWVEPDPARASAGTTRRQAPFAGSDRQGRGRLVAALCRGAVAAGDVAAAAGWPADPARASAVADALAKEGLAVWRDGDLCLAR
jgi:A/G-specific adenine glycosylase